MINLDWIRSEAGSFVCRWRRWQNSRFTMRERGRCRLRWFLIQENCLRWFFLLKKIYLVKKSSQAAKIPKQLQEMKAHLKIIIIVYNVMMIVAIKKWCDDNCCNKKKTMWLLQHPAQSHDLHSPPRPMVVLDQLVAPSSPFDYE